jgi:ABC-type Na+ efflux pump permease subunit
MAALLWLAGWRARGMPWLNPRAAFASSIVLHLCFNWILAYAAGKRLAQERQSGGFEVLLTTPLDPVAIVDGQCKALLVQFRSVWLTVFVFDVVLCGSGFAAPGWSAAVAGIYLAAWCVLVAFWFAKHLETASQAMWISAWTGRPAYAAIQAIKPTHLRPHMPPPHHPAYAAIQAIKPTVGILVWVWLVSATRGLSRRPTNALAAVFVLALSSAVFASFRKRRVLREKLARELRLIACAPIPARGDKRFRKWDPDRIFPPGRWGEFQLFPAKPRRSR